jgi:cytochrome c oxidase cbb3-type subunit 3
MTRNLLIATLFLFGSTVLLGVIWVREHYVLSERAARFDGALLSRGASDYEQYCASCHGLVGEGGVSSGAPPINNLPTTLQEQGRLEGPTGITAKYGTVRNFIDATITSGVKGTAMPRWSNRLGGPLRDDQIRNIAFYVSNWWAEPGNTNPNITVDAAGVAATFKATAQAAALAQAASDTPVGRGQAIFTAQCAACHSLNDKDSGIPAPGLGGMFTPEGTAAFGTQLPNGKPVDPANFFEWVKMGGAAFKAQEVQPASGHGPYIIEAMPPFPTLTDEQLADLLAFISVHDRSGEESLPPIGPDGQPLPEEPAGTPTPTN